MESEKVKEIKEALAQNSGYIPFFNEYEVLDDVAYSDILTLINELESENERLNKELDSEWKDRRKAEEDLHKAQWHYKIGLAQSRKRNKELKDRIAELEKEKEETMKAWLEDRDGVFWDGVAEGELKGYKQLKQFAEKLMNYSEFLLHADDNGNLLYVDFTVWLDETLKEFIDD